MFKEFSDQVKANFVRLSEDNQVKVFSTNVDSDLLFEKYMSSFPAEHNGIFRSREQYNCNSCRSFIKRLGGLLFIKGNEVFTVWDNISCSTSYYNDVANAMREYVLSFDIRSLFLTSHNLKTVSTPFSYDNYDNGLVWYHFSGVVPNRLIVREPGTKMGNYNSKVGVFKRGLTELTDYSIDAVLDLIDQNALYKGTEYLSKLNSLKKLRLDYNNLVSEKEKDIFVWMNIHSPGALLKNEVIGTLLEDLSEGKDLEEAVKSFEVKVAPANYKRPTALITKKMIEDATKKIDELGIRDSLQRRHARLSDITINNVIFADANAIPLMKDPLKDLLMTQAKPAKTSIDGEEVSINDFISNIIPTARAIDVLFEAKHTNKLVTLIAPEIKDSKNILKYGNNFSWSYNGNITDSDIKQRVKAAGGDINKDLRVSLSWFNFDDLDIHCKTPNGPEIAFDNKMGILDVDMNAGSGSTREAVENLAWNLNQLIEDKAYTVIVHNFAKRESIDVGFDIEVEFNGQLTTYYYANAVKHKESVVVLQFKIVRGQLEIFNENKELSKSGASISKTEWDISTNIFHKVNAIMLSPNYWDNNKEGNKHFFFMINGCRSDLGMRGLYNEFLSNELTPHRKVFEVLGGQLKCKDSREQLSGLGFSSTIPEELKVQVTSESGTRNYKIKF